MNLTNNELLFVYQELEEVSKLALLQNMKDGDQDDIFQWIEFKRLLDEAFQEDFIGEFTSQVDTIAAHEAI